MVWPGEEARRIEAGSGERWDSTGVGPVVAQPAFSHNCLCAFIVFLNLSP